MALIEFQTALQAKYVISKYVVKITATNMTFADMSNLKVWSNKSGKVGNWQTAQELAPFCFFHQKILFFSCRFFLYKSQISIAGAGGGGVLFVTDFYQSPVVILITGFNFKIKLSKTKIQ